ncbi:hypothetical protein SeMB42_g00946 [Synchytrium endobioticum]|uniref:MutL C-terminal dimerisation domain-containing protein n=1 Tax=Synchytrium endobioticum TaxID=286115 RepID=A0A507DPP6_9FUNG|nr:hypothetical protein SeMB42_g00946 [Synchytrium endobioticum]
MTSKTQLQVLSKDTISQLRSSLVITDFAQCAVELLANSLDADAKVITVSVDTQEANVPVLEVTDDGSGIDPTSLRLLGQRYATSKWSNEGFVEASTFGFRGEALASIAEVATLDFTSKVSGEAAHRVVIKSGTSYRRMPVANIKHSGTIVVVRDIFHKFPVRRKALMHMDVLDAIRRAVEPITLMHPYLTMTIIDKVKNLAILSKRKTTSSLSAMRQVFGLDISKMQEFKLSAGKYRVSGFFSTRGFLSKYHQYVFVNKHLLAHCDIHKVVNRMFAASRFVKQNDDDGVFQLASSSSPKKRVLAVGRITERHPIFFFQIQAPLESYDALFDPTKNQVAFKEPDTVMNLVENAVTSFLIANHFLPPQSQLVTTSRQTTVEEDMASDIAETGSDSESAPDASIMPKHAFEQCIPIKAAKFTSFDDDFKNCGEDGQPKESVLVGDLCGVDTSEFEVHQNLKTMKTFFIDKRTGNSYHTLPGADSSVSKSAPGFVNRTGLKSNRDGREMSSTAALWAQDTLKKWNNPVFGAAEKSVLDTANVTKFWDKARNLFSGVFMDGQSLSKQDLAHMEVIGQIDCKFIAARLERPNMQHTLAIVIDQHAADERVKLEALLSEFTDSSVEISTVILEPPLRIMLLPREIQSAMKYTKAFERWGITYDSIHLEPLLPNAVPILQQDEPKEVLVTTLPQAIADRCVSDIRITRDLIRQHLRALEEGLTGISFPRGIIDILHSKACRSAIMFGHELSYQECCRLLMQLEQCKFPFQCAHGRPSMMPIAQLEEWACSNDDDGVFQLASSSSPKKRVLAVGRITERHPIFFFQIQAPLESYDALFDPTKNQVAFKEPDTVMNLVENAVTSFLIANHFLPPQSQLVTTSRQTTVEEDMASDIAETGSDSESAPDASIMPKHAFEQCIPIKAAKFTSFDDDFKNCGEDGQPKESVLVGDLCGVDTSEFEVHQNLKTMKTFFIDKRTGNSYHTLPGADSSVSKSAPGFVNRTGLKSNRDGREMSSTAALWAQDTLKKWNNPVFGAAEKSVLDTANVTKFWDKARNLFSGVFMDGQSLSKQDLAHMEVIGQIDCKFIAARLERPNMQHTLAIVIDQHAADERVKLEALLSEFTDSSVEISTVILEPPLRIMLLPREIQSAMKYTKAFERWGITYDSIHLEPLLPNAVPILQQDEPKEVLVTTLPQAIADRCVSDIRITRDLIRQHLRALEEGLTGISFPRGIIDILHSKACRSAIMFGHELSYQECCRLLMQLEQCKFPFQCAHGRPSMMPIAQLEEWACSVGSRIQSRDKLSLHRLIE